MLQGIAGTSGGLKQNLEKYSHAYKIKVQIIILFQA